MPFGRTPDGASCFDPPFYPRMELRIWSTEGVVQAPPGDALFLEASIARPQLHDTMKKPLHKARLSS